MQTEIAEPDMSMVTGSVSLTCVQQLSVRSMVHQELALKQAQRQDTVCDQADTHQYKIIRFSYLM